MPSIVDGLLDAAQRDLGYREQSNGYTKFGEWYYANVDKSDSYFKTAPWCDMFVTWAAHQAGVEEYVGEFAYTVDHAKWFRQQDAWSEEPEPGAIVFFDWSGGDSVEGIDHVGIVEKVDGSKVFTIEGNADRVWLKRKERDPGKIVGYGLPRKVQENLGARVESASEQVESAAVGSASQPPMKASAVQHVSVSARQPFAGVTSELPQVQDATASAAVLVALLCAAVAVKRVRDRRPAHAVGGGGRSQRASGWNRDLFA